MSRLSEIAEVIYEAQVAVTDAGYMMSMSDPVPTEGAELDYVRRWRDLLHEWSPGAAELRQKLGAWLAEQGAGDEEARERAAVTTINDLKDRCTSLRRRVEALPDSEQGVSMVLMARAREAVGTALVAFSRAEEALADMTQLLDVLEGRPRDALTAALERIAGFEAGEEVLDRSALIETVQELQGIAREALGRAS